MKKLLSLLVTVAMVLLCALPAFAEDGDEDTPSVLRIPNGTKIVTSSTLDDGVIDRLRVKTIYVPASVTTVKDGALTGYANVTNVYVENSKDNITIEDGALPTGTNIVYTEKPTEPVEEPKTTKKAEEPTTKDTDSEEKTTKKSDSEEKPTTKPAKQTTKKSHDKTTKKGNKKTTKKDSKSKKRTVSSSATTSDPKNRITVQHRTLTVPNTKEAKTKSAKDLLPDVEVDPDKIVEQPDSATDDEVTTATFSGEAITDKDGTIIGFEDPRTDHTQEERAESRAKVITLAGVGLVGVSAVVFLFFKLRKRP